MKIATECDLRSEAKANAFTLEQAVSERQVRCEQCCEQAEAAGTVVGSMQKHVADLENELTQAVANSRTVAPAG